MRSVGSFLKDAYRLAKPYFARSDERLFAWGMLIAIIVLNLTMVGMSVILNFGIASSTMRSRPRTGRPSWNCCSCIAGCQAA